MNELNSSGNNYQAIFGGSNYETEVESELELPQSVVFGYSYTPNDKWTLNWDVEWMDWSSVEYELITWDESNATRLSVLNAGDPAPKDWKSALSSGLGAEYKWNNRLRLRGGYFFHETPIPDEHFHTNLPDSNSHGLSVGFGYDLNNKTTFDLAYSHMFFENRTIDNSSAGSGISGEYREYINMVLATVSRRF